MAVLTSLLRITLICCPFVSHLLCQTLLSPLFFHDFVLLGLLLELALVLHEQPLLDQDLLVSRLQRRVARVVLRELLEPLGVEDERGVVALETVLEARRLLCLCINRSDLTTSNYIFFKI